MGATDTTSEGEGPAPARKTMRFLGDGVSAGLDFTGGDPARVEELGLPALASAEDLARAIGLPAAAGEGSPAFSEGSDQLAWLCYHRRSALVDHYSRFRIPKRNGGSRRLASPKPLMRRAQRWVLENIVEHLEPHTGVATAWRPGLSIRDNAARHVGKAIVLRIDIKDFFPSIRWKRVRGVLMRCGYNEGIATLLALLCTDADRVAVELDGKKHHVARGERALPQGACTSPGLANHVARRLDLRVDGLARSLGFTYSRYADDLIFSHEQERGRADVLIEKVYTILRDEGFEPNVKKTSVMRSHRRQMVTGILVNEEPRLSRRDCRRFRAIAHQCRTKGLEAVSEQLGRDAAAYLAGFLAYAHMVNPDQAVDLGRLVDGLDVRLPHASRAPGEDARAAGGERAPEPAAAGERAARAPEEFTPYVDETPMGPRTDLDPDSPNREAITRAIEAVLAVEAPVHPDRLASLVGRHFDLKRVHGKRRDLIRSCIPEGLEVEGPRGPFVWSRERSPGTWSGHRRTPDGSDRQVLEIAPEEIRNAMVHLLTEGGALDREDLIREAATRFGCKRVAKRIVEHVGGSLDWAIEHGAIVERDGQLGVPTP